MEIEILLSTIKNLLPTDMDVQTFPVQKGSRKLTSVTIGNDTLRPAVYMENYEELFNESGYSAVAKAMIKHCADVEPLDINAHEIVTFDYIKQHVQFCIAPSGTNENNVTIPYLDLELYFRVYVGNEGTYKISNAMLKMLGITVEELLDIAVQNTKFSVRSMKEIMVEKMGIPEEMFANTPEQIIVTNSSFNYGASALYNIEIFKELADKYQDDLCIIPSSVHELIVKPLEETTFSLDSYNEMVQDVNETELSQEDILSNHIYIFRKETSEITW